MKKTFKIPDLNAPRFRQRSRDIITDEFIEMFIEKFPKYKGISKKEFKGIIKEFNNIMFEEIINTRDGVRFPESIGTVFIGTCPPPKQTYNPDFSLLHKNNITASNRNWETDGNIAKIFYITYSEKYKYKFRELWYFIPCRIFTRAVSQEYRKNWNMYHRVDPKRKLNEQYLKAHKRMWLKNKLKNEKSNYNDLEL
jgi:hypothetical protein